MDTSGGLLVERRADGCTLVRRTAPLPPYRARVTEALLEWAAATPDGTFLAERDGDGWRRLSYGQALASVRAIAQGLLQRRLSAERPVLILSGNSIDHALLGLACLHIGVAYAPVSVAYSLASADLAKLKQIVALTTPGLVFAAGDAFGRALDAAIPGDVETVQSLDSLCANPTACVEDAFARVDGDTVAKLLFTSGSTGAPKAVINTHRMLCANQAMLAGRFGFLRDEPPILVDWLPWSHTFGGNHNFNAVLFNGGTLYIDPGRPLPGQFEPTVQALREIAPTLHLAVPKAWEELARHLRADPDLNRRFYSRMRVPFYAAAALPQPVWDDLQSLSREATGAVVPMVTGLGSTETAPMALCIEEGEAQAGHVGQPMLGLELKLTPNQGKLELCIKGPSITPGYWRNAALTQAAFDDEGFFRMGDAVAWIDPARPERGLRFDGRLAEDFKLSSGTWVSVGPLRARLIAALAPHVRDVVIAGHDRDSLAALALPADPVAATDPAIRTWITGVLSELAASAAGSSARVTRLAFLTGTLSIDAGEVTDKGSINQAAVLRCRAAAVADLYAEPPPPHVLCARPAWVAAQEEGTQGMRRRTILMGGAAALAWGSRTGQAADKPLKIGVLNDMSGVFADYQGCGSLLATQMAVEDAGGHAGSRAVEVVFADHQNKPDTGMAIARKWLDQEGVDVVMDVPNSSIALGVAQFVTERNRVFIGAGAGTADLTGSRCSPNIIHWDYDTWEVSHALGRAITERGGKTWFTLAADYVFGADLDRNVSEAVLAAGGKIVGGVKAPFQTSDFSSYLLAAQSSGAQVLALNNSGDDTTTALKQAAEFGLTRSMQVCGPIYNINITKGVGLQVAQGVLGVTPFYWDMNDGTRAFSRRYLARDGRHAMPNDMQAAMYSATMHLLKVVAGGADPADGRAVVAAMKALPTDDPLFGQGTIREDGRKMHPVYLFQTKTPAESKGEWDFYTILSAIAADKAFRPLADGHCAFVKS